MGDNSQIINEFKKCIVEEWEEQSLEIVKKLFLQIFVSKNDRYLML